MKAGVLLHFVSDQDFTLSGCEHLKNDHGVIIDYNTSDPLIRWDSYENMSPDGEGEESKLVPRVLSEQTKIKLLATIKYLLGWEEGELPYMNQ